MLQKEDIKQIGKVVKKEISSAIQANNLLIKRGFDSVDKRFEQVDQKFEEIAQSFKDVQYQISLRPTLEKIMQWSDRRIFTVEMDLQNVQYILRDQWGKLPPRRKVHKTLVDRGIIK